MKVLGGWGDAGVPRGAVIGIGNFDGLHRGHMAVVRDVLRRARGADVPAGLLTFDPHPQAVIGLRPPPPLIQTWEEKEEILAAEGVDFLVRQPFNGRLASMPAGEFIRVVLREHLAPRGVVVGHDFRFGAGGGGDVRLLQEAKEEAGFEVTAVDEVLVDGAPVRSSRIRDLLSAGDVAGAAVLLDRPYSLTGTVASGTGVGRELGFPTVNLPPPDKLVPPEGVYAGEAIVGGGAWPAAINIGAPHAGPLVVEAHLVGFSGDLYGRRVTLLFLERLREERKFPDRAALSSQIARDVREATDIHRRRRR